MNFSKNLNFKFDITCNLKIKEESKRGGDEDSVFILFYAANVTSSSWFCWTFKSFLKYTEFTVRES